MRFELALLVASLAGSAFAAPYGRVSSGLVVSTVIHSRNVSLSYANFSIRSGRMLKQQAQPTPPLSPGLPGLALPL